MAREVLAYADYRAGKIKEAPANIDALADDPQCARRAARRARAMAAFLQSGGARDFGTVPPPAAGARAGRARPAAPALRRAPRHERFRDGLPVAPACCRGRAAAAGRLQPIPSTRSAAGSSSGKKSNLKGERISLMSLDEELKPDPTLASTPGRAAGALSQSRMAAAGRLSLQRHVSSGGAGTAARGLGRRCRQGLGYGLRA